MITRAIKRRTLICPSHRSNRSIPARFTAPSLSECSAKTASDKAQSRITNTALVLPLNGCEQ